MPGRRPGRAGSLGGPADAAGHGLDRQATGARKFGNLYSELLEFIIPADLSFYALMVGAVILLRRKAPGLKRPYRTPGYPVPALIFIGLAILLVLDFVYLAPATSGIGYLIVLAGIPVYFIWSRRSAAGIDGCGVELRRTMIVSWNWLTQYVRLAMPVEVLTERLALAGLNHESTAEVGGDLAIDLEVTSNRPDCLGHLGVAREIAVLFNTGLTVPDPRSAHFN